MDAHQIWHRDGDKYRKVADVQALDALEAANSTQNNKCKDDPHEGQWWVDQAGVINAANGNHRSTTFGDIIITPDGQEYMIVIRDGGERFGLLLTDAIREQGYVEWLDAQPECPLEPELTREEQAALFREWRDDASQRALVEKGVDYSDAPYRELGEASYAEQRQAASARAGHRPREADTPQL